MDRLASARKAELIRLGLAGEEEWDDDGKGTKKHLIPLWTVEDHYWWTQTFPGGARGAASTIATSRARAGASRAFIAFPEYRNTPEARRDNRQILRRPGNHRCGRQAPQQGARRPTDAAADGRIYPDRRAANWARPIGDFRLVVDKGKPGNLVSFCGEGVRKISPTQFEMRKRNWRPTRDLDVLILEPRR